MRLRALQLRRRRWTLVFSLPFTAFMAVIGAFSVFLMLTGDRFSVMIGGCGAFVALCVGGSLGKSALEAWRNEEPAVIIDQHGLNDLRGEAGLIPWHEIETVKLDDYERRILVKLAKTAATSQELRSTTRRLFVGADYSVALGGLSYKPRELAKALADHHRYDKADSPAKTAASGA